MFLYAGSDRAGDLARAQATGAGVNILGRTVNDRFHALHVGLPGTVAPTMGVRHLNAESDAFTTTITLCHLLHLLVIKSLNYTIRNHPEMQEFF